MLLLIALLACTSIPDTGDADPRDSPAECFAFARLCYWDNDGDGYGAEEHAFCSDPWQARPEGCAVFWDDCDDSDPEVYPNHGC